MVLVTDVKTIKKNGKESYGFYMDGYLAQNLNSIPGYLAKAWDCVGIISGHGKVRIGKSTMAMEVAYYLAWLLAGGEMDFFFGDTGKNVKCEVKKKPNNEIRFSLEENVVFSAEQLQKTARNLFEKYGKGQVIVYDEGRQGLDSSRAMENVNKGMQDFFQECGFMGHVILIVLPNFFKLQEDFAVARSLFLIDVFAKDGIERGYFNFYNEKQKEYLYFFGKKKLGVSAKYSSANPNFWGRFGMWLPFDKILYEEAKLKGMKEKNRNRTDIRIKFQRDVLLYILHVQEKMKIDEILKRLKEIGNIEVSYDGTLEMIRPISELAIRKQIGEGGTSV